jgi:hypothetical protein
MNDDKCYICFDTEGILNKTCINKKCTAMTHFSCLQMQSITSKICGICRSNIIINRNRINFIKFLFIIFSFILQSYLIFVMIIELKPLNPLNNITIISVIKYSTFNYSYLILAAFFLLNYFIHVNILCGNNELIQQYNYKYGECGTILLFSTLELIFILVCHIIGHIIGTSYDEIFTSQTFLFGFIFLSSIFLISCIISRHIFHFY